MSPRKHKKTESPEPTDAPTSWRESLYRPIVLFWLAVFCISPLIYAKVKTLQQQWQVNSQFALDESSFVFRNLPPGLPPDWQARVTTQLLSTGPLTFTQDDLAARLGRQLESLPWVKTVRQVKLQYPRTVEIDVDIRQPVAMVKIKTGYYPIDADAILLPPKDFTTEDVSKFPLIINSQTLPQGPAGIVWGDPGILGAAKLAAALLQPLKTSSDPKHLSAWQSWNLESISIDRPNLADAKLEDFNYRLHSQGGTQFLWGLAPGFEQPREPDPANKLQRLARFIHDMGPTSSYPQPLEVDLRAWQEITYQPLKKSSQLSGREKSPATQRR